MTYTDLTPICQITPAVSSGDINAQANSILKVLSGEDATFDISSGGLSLPLSGYSTAQYTLPTRTLNLSSWTSKSLLTGLSITSQPTADSCQWQLNPNITYTYIEANVIPVAMLVHYYKYVSGSRFQNIHPVLAFNTSTKQFELRQGTVSSDNTILYSAWDGSAKWEQKNSASMTFLNQLLNKGNDTNQSVLIGPTSISSSSNTTQFYTPLTSQTAINCISPDSYYIGLINFNTNTGVTQYYRSSSATYYQYML